MEQVINILTVIVRKAGQGDESSRAALYRQFSQKMFSICVRMTGNRSDAEDILQDSFIHAFNHLHQLKQRHLFEAWLRKIVVNECIRYTKKAFQWKVVDEEIADTTEEDNLSWLQVIDLEQVHHEIKNLPDGCREIFNLFVLEDFSHQQIAEALGISVSTSKSQYHRARGLLKERLLKKLVHHG